MSSRQDMIKEFQEGVKMTKQRLGKLRALIKEAEHLQSEIDEMICFPKEMVSDSVKDYSTGYPRTIMLQGYGQNDYVDLKQNLYNKLHTIQKEIAFLEEWLNSITEPEIRDILRLQYINGLTQEEIAGELGYVRETVSRKIKKFWKEERSH